jgi:aminopeptidase-like protein
MTKRSSEIQSYLERLFPICRSITGEGNRRTLEILQEIIPLIIYEVPSGKRVFDWVVPDEWKIRDAWIADDEGNRIVDFKQSNVHVVSYSEPVSATMTWDKLSSHVHKHPEIPDAVPYRTSYYKRDWGFCVTHEQYEKLASSNTNFEVVIDSEFLNNGSLSYGELVIPGHSEEEILISTYICHPSMANDNLSGFLLTAFLAREIQKLEIPRFTYRIIFVPETIGAITYCALNMKIMKNIDMGFVITTVGGKGNLGYKKSFDQDHFLNHLVEDVLLDEDKDYKIHPFSIHGSDERQYSSIDFRINTVSITKDKYYDYPFYHSSLDNLDFVNSEQITQTLQVYEKVIYKLESLEIYKNLNPSCEVMLSKHGLYPEQGGAQVPEDDDMDELDVRMWLLWLCDGNTPLSSIARKLQVDIIRLQTTALVLEEKGILSKV